MLENDTNIIWLMLFFYTGFQCYVGEDRRHLLTNHLSTCYAVWPMSEMQVEQTSLQSNSNFSDERWIYLTLNQD